MLTALLALALAAGEANPPAALLGRLLAPTPLLDDLRELTDGIGGRPSGSLAMKRATEWALSRLEAAGLENAHLEEFRGPSWMAREERAELVAPRAAWQRSHRLRVATMPFSTDTPAEGLEAEVIDLGEGATEAFKAAGAAVRGRWVLVHTQPMASWEDLFKEYLETAAVLPRARDAGAAGVLWMSTHPGRVLYRHVANVHDSGKLLEISAAVLEREGGLRIARLLAGGQRVRLKLTLQGQYAPEAPVRNVVAEVRGREKPDEVIQLGAHLDGWDLGSAANDNGCNAALVIDVARQAMALASGGARPRRTLRFVLYDGEEAGMYGSWLEARAHRADLDKLKAQVVFDSGSGRTTGFSLGGRADLKAAVEAALLPASALGPFAHTLDAAVGTDNYDYLVEGVPNLVANQEAAPYLPDYHAESDTFDKVNLRELKANAAIAGVLLWGLAEREAPPGPRQSRAEVEAVVKATHLDEQMKAFDLWKPFQSGERGRQPQR
jgi:carboxypeptidase Q